jgi:hypothetical protein
MTPDQAVVAVLGALDAAGVPSMVVGSLASNVHGIPRSTQDADLVVDLAPGSVERLAGQLPSELSLAPQASFEAVTGTSRLLVTLAGHPFVCELFLLSDDPHDRERFVRRIPVRILGHPAFVASAEDMIVTKLRWAAGAMRPKDREDVRNMLAVQGPALDWSYIDRWTSVHGTSALLAEIRASLPAMEE